MDLCQKVVALGFSGGPDALALAYRLKERGAIVLPVYLSYRQNEGGKTAKDLVHAKAAAKAIDLHSLILIRAPLGKVKKSYRNRFIVQHLALIVADYGGDTVALGTIANDVGSNRKLTIANRNDLNPAHLSKVGKRCGVDVITWDTFEVSSKTQEFEGLNTQTKAALALTTSCQMWWKQECGVCYSCRARHRAFVCALGFDPTNYKRYDKLSLG